MSTNLTCIVRAKFFGDGALDVNIVDEHTIEACVLATAARDFLLNAGRGMGRPRWSSTSATASR